MAYVNATAYWFWQALVESVKLDVMTENEKQLCIDGGCLSLCSDYIYAYAPVDAGGSECVVERGHMHFIPKESCYDTLGVLVWFPNHIQFSPQAVEMHVYDHTSGCERCAVSDVLGSGYHRSQGLTMTKGRAFRYVVRATATGDFANDHRIEVAVCPFLYNSADYDWPDTDIAYVSTSGWAALGSDCRLNYSTCTHCDAPVVGNCDLP